MKNFLYMMLTVFITFVVSKATVNYYFKNYSNNAVASVNQKLVSNDREETIASVEANSSQDSLSIYNQQYFSIVTPKTEVINEVAEKSIESVVNDVTKIHNDDIVLGNKNSNIVVIEYFSFTCEYCAFYHQKIFPEIQKKYIDTNKIVYIIREFISNKQDFEASILARCSNDPNKFLQFQDILLKQQNDWIFNEKFRDILTNIGQLGGISVKDFNKCLKDPAIAEMLLSKSRLTTKVKGFEGVPTFIINGKLTVFPEVINIIEQKLNNQ